MARYVAMVLAALGLFLATVYTVNHLGAGLDRRTSAEAQLAYARGQARAVVIEAQGQRQAQVIEAQGQARLDSAAALSVASYALLPWGVLAVLGLLGLAIVALLGLVTIRRPQSQIVERQVVYLPAPGQARREVWQALSHGRGEVLALPAVEATEVTRD